MGGGWGVGVGVGGGGVCVCVWGGGGGGGLCGVGAPSLKDPTNPDATRKYIKRLYISKHLYRSMLRCLGVQNF